MVEGPEPADVDVVSRLAFRAIWTGEPLPLREIEARTAWPRRRVQAAVEQLEQAGRLQTDNGEILGAHGVTLRSTPHRIRHGCVETHTWCAYDAVGIPAALEIDAEVASTCPACQGQIVVQVRGGVPGDQSLVLWMPFGAFEHIMRDFCSAANLFCSGDHLEGWRRSAGNPDGAALTLQETAEHGRRAWSDVAARTRAETRSAHGGLS